jgi:hypothetical protein
MMPSGWSVVATVREAKGLMKRHEAKKEATCQFLTPSAV